MPHEDIAVQRRPLRQSRPLFVRSFNDSGYLVLQHDSVIFYIAAFAGDVVDGYVARAFNQSKLRWRILATIYQAVTFFFNKGVC